MDTRAGKSLTKNLNIAFGLEPTYQTVYNWSEKGKAARQKYDQSEKGKETRERYSRSEKAKEAHRTYSRTEKGRRMDLRKKHLKRGKQLLSMADIYESLKEKGMTKEQAFKASKSLIRTGNESSEFYRIHLSKRGQKLATQIFRKRGKMR
ncbi:MAG: hypothetical protein V1911_03575 [Candidatus Micrarchaeota archaeon]